MTVNNIHVLTSWLAKYAKENQNSQILRLTDSLNEIYENNESDSTEEVAKKIVQVILDSHMIQLEEHQLPAHNTFWLEAISDIRS